MYVSSVSVNGDRNRGLVATPIGVGDGRGCPLGPGPKRRPAWAACTSSSPLRSHHAEQPSNHSMATNIKPRSAGRKNEHVAGLCPFVSEPPPYAQTKRAGTLTPMTALNTKKNSFFPYLFLRLRISNIAVPADARARGCWALPAAHPGKLQLHWMRQAPDTPDVSCRQR
jgi:hypothetical protein